MLTKLNCFLSTKHPALVRLLLIELTALFLELLRLQLGMLVYHKYLIVNLCVIIITFALSLFVSQHNKTMTPLAAMIINLVSIVSILNNIASATLPLWGITLLMLFLSYSYQQVFTISKLWQPVTVAFNVVCLVSILKINDDLIILSMIILLVGGFIYFASDWLEQKLTINELKQEKDALAIVNKEDKITVTGKILYNPKSKNDTISFWVLGQNGPVFVKCDSVECQLLIKGVTVTCHGVVGGTFIDTMQNRPITFLIADWVRVKGLQLPREVGTVGKVP